LAASEAQRASVPKPRVGARHVSPPKLRAKEGAPTLGTCSGRIINPNGVVPRHGTGPRGTTPLRLGAWARVTQGSSGCAAATLGSGTESRWDSRSRHEMYIRSMANNVAPADGRSPRRSFCGPAAWLFGAARCLAVPAVLASWRLSVFALTRGRRRVGHGLLER
jgi:hypothetical protein